MEEELTERISSCTADTERVLVHRKMTQMFAYNLLRDAAIRADSRYAISLLLESYAFRAAVAPQYFEAPSPTCTWWPFFERVSSFIKKLHVENALEKDMANDEDWERWMDGMGCKEESLASSDFA